MSSCRRTSSSEKPRRRRSRKKPSPRVPSLVDRKLRQMARTRGARAFGLTGEDLLGSQDVGGDEFASLLGDLDVGVGNFGQPEELGGIDQGEEVIHLEGEIVGQSRQILSTTAGVQDLQQPGHTAERRLGQRHLCRGALAMRHLRPHLLRHFGRAPGHDAVDLVHQRREGLVVAVSGSDERARYSERSRPGFDERRKCGRPESPPLRCCA